jgi:hypothetical protein
MTDGAFVNHLVLPQGTDMDRILVHGDRVERLTRWAGAKQLVLAGADLGYERPEMTDIDSTADGVAVFKGLNKQPEQELSVFRYVDDNNPVRRQLVTGIMLPIEKINSEDLAVYKADSLVIHIDKAGLTDKVKDDPKNRKSFTDEVIWAKHLDKEIRDSVVSAAVERYDGQHKILSAFFLLANVGYYLEIYDMINTGDPAYLALAFKSLQMVAGTHRIRTGEATMKDANWTTMIGSLFRTDRLIMTAALARLGGKLIKVAE